MAPPPVFSIAAAACLQHRNMPRASIAMVRSQRSALAAGRSASGMMPALAMRISTHP